MDVCVSLSSTRPAMTPWDTRAAQRDGVPFRAWRRSCCLWSACSLVSQDHSQSEVAIKFSFYYMWCVITCVTIVFFYPTEPNDESGANVDASKMWREDREQFDRLAKQIVRKSLSLWLARTQTRAHTRTHSGPARIDVYEDVRSRQKSGVVVYYPPTSTSVSTLLPSRLSYSLLSPLLHCHWPDERTDGSKNARHYTSTGQCSCRKSRISRRISARDGDSQPFRTVYLLCLLPVHTFMR